ncbi:hypothetical protein LTR78_008449 [Recurvomyces mirabilis]|uniref:Rhodopsin domain-containing protein n=1 Tax=Recurvomyces mirabilis TaxID=574656 RepID=A0AAE0WGZ8_9PEZI|nr:hypothetical protein LTR78_008449 [Recurvomyces mirabilis]KAK5155437.1 hypothetical protein LTS14_005698 [Recurvomyces mirabilis]
MPGYAITLFAVGSLMVATRFWLRATAQLGTQHLGLDDLLLFAGWLGGVMFLVVILIGDFNYDVGRHAWDVPLTKYEGIAEMTWLAELAFLISGGFTKISVLLFYRHIVDGTYKRRWKVAVIFAITFTAAYSVAFILTLIFNCSPTDAYWKAFDPTYTRHYTCVDTTVINLLAGIAAAFSDLYSVILPSTMVWSISLPKRQKFALLIVFSLGLVVVAASGVRTYYLYEVGHNSDVSWMIFDVFVWAHLELQLGLMCASAPALRVLFRKYLSQTLQRSMHGSRQRIESRQSVRRLDASSIHRVSGAEDYETMGRSDFGRGAAGKSSKGDLSFAETETDNSPLSSLDVHEHRHEQGRHVVKTPADYEV